MTDTPSERLHKLAEEFHKFVNGEQSVIENSDISIEELTTNFGLSLSQAKAWLKKEPNYQQTNFHMNPKTARDFTEPPKWFCELFVCRVLL